MWFGGNAIISFQKPWSSRFLASSIFSMSDCHLPFFGCSFFMAEIIIALEYLHCLGMALVLSITLLIAFIEFYEPSQQCKLWCTWVLNVVLSLQANFHSASCWHDWIWRLAMQIACLAWLVLYGYGRIEKSIFYGNVIQICWKKYMEEGLQLWVLGLGFSRHKFT